MCGHVVLAHAQNLSNHRGNDMRGHVFIGSGAGAVHTHCQHIRMSVFHVHLVSLHHPVLSLIPLQNLTNHRGDDMRGHFKHADHFHELAHWRNVFPY